MERQIKPTTASLQNAKFSPDQESAWFIALEEALEQIVWNPTGFHAINLNADLKGWIMITVLLLKIAVAVGFGLVILALL